MPGRFSARNGAESFVGVRLLESCRSCSSVTMAMNATAMSIVDAEERAAPADRAEQTAEQGADGDAEAERRLVEDDRRAPVPPTAAPTMVDERGGDEERVAEPPSGAEVDDAHTLFDEAASTEKTTISARPMSRVLLRADAARDPAREEHRDAGDGEVAREEQLGLRRGSPSGDAAIAGRIGSTRPMPMNATTQAKAIAQTAGDCLRMEPVWGEGEVGTDQLYSLGMYPCPFPELVKGCVSTGSTNARCEMWPEHGPSTL